MFQKSLTCIAWRINLLPTALLALGLGAGLLLDATRLARAADSADVAGKVIERSGTGIEAAQVWAVVGRRDGPRTIARATTDRQGSFLFPRIWNTAAGADSEPLRYVSLVARSRDGRVGWRGLVQRDNPKPITITLQEVAEASGRLIDQTGKPIPGAEIAPVMLSQFILDPDQRNQAMLPVEIGKLFRTSSGPDGSFVLRGLPPKAQIGTEIRARGFGSSRVGWDLSQPVSITLDGRLGRIKGRLKPPDARALKSAITLVLQSKIDSNILFDSNMLEPPPGKSRVLVLRTTRAGADGSFQFDELPPGEYSIILEFGPGVTLVAQRVEAIKLEPGAAAAQVEIPLEHLLKISGRVVDEATGQGIAGVRLWSGLIENNRLEYVGHATTDAQGRYTIGARRGMMQVRLSESPRSYLELETAKVPSLKVEADQTWPDFKLSRATDLDGVVVDRAGKPVPAAKVFLITSDPSRSSSRPVVTTGSDGTFHLEQVDPTDSLPVRARTNEAATEGAVVIRPAEQKTKGPLLLRIAPEFAFKVKGRVVDRAGNPLTGAKLNLWCSGDYVSQKVRYSGLGGQLESFTTDSDGRFASHALWSGDRYKVAIEAEGYGRVESPEVAGKSRETRDFGTLTLTSISGFIAGIVVGSDGKPIAGVEVFNHGDGPQAVSTRTDAAGRFRLDGLFPETKFAFARQNGYRFTGVRVEGDRDDRSLALLKTSEPPPAWKAGATASYDQERGLAKRALIEIWERFSKRGDIGQNGTFRGILDMAKIDPELALKWSAEHGHRYDDRARQAQAEELAETDAQETLALLTALPAKTGQPTLQQLAERFAETDREKALLFAQEAAVQARALSQPDRSRAMAHAGAVLARLGHVDAGKKLIDEAVVNALRLGTDGMNGYTRASVAGAVARFDVPMALRLIEPLKAPDDRDRYTGFVALGLAASDPARAVAMVDAMEGNTTMPEMVRTEVAYRIGRDRPDEAVKIIEGMKGYFADKYRAEAFAWLAMEVAPKDKPRAFALIDRALALPIDRPKPFESCISFGAGTASAGWIAACARQIGYPDMESVAMRVLAARSSSPRNVDLAALIASATIGAAVVALIDPAAARDMLRQIETRSGLRPTELCQVAGYRWLSAWALADLKHAEELFHAELAALAAQQDRNPPLNLQSIGLFQMAEILAVPPERRLTSLREGIGGSWRPGMRY